MPGTETSRTSIDVVIPTRNRANLAVAAACNALQQTGVDVRVIVVVDGTEDDTAHAVHRIGDDRVSVVEHPTRRGLAASRNDGIAHGSAPWIAFLDDDDRWAPDKLHAQVAALAKEPPAAWAVTGCVRTDGELRPLTTWGIAEGGGEIFDRLRKECLIPAGGSSVMVSRSMLERVGVFDTHFGAVEDWDFWLRLALESPIAYVDRPLVAYRRWDGNMSNDLPAMGEHQDALKARYADNGETSAEKRYDIGWQQWIARRALYDGHRFHAARTYASVAFKGRSPGQLLYAAGAVTSPRFVRAHLDARDRAAARTEWLEEAQKWLRDVPH